MPLPDSTKTPALSSIVGRLMRTLRTPKLLKSIIAPGDDDLLSKVIQRDHSAVALLLEKGAHERRANHRTTALMTAAKNWDTRMVQMLLDAKASNPGAIDDNGRTALHYAAHPIDPVSDINPIPLLLPLCDPLAADIKGQTALILAAGSNHVETLRLLLNSSDIHARTAAAIPGQKNTRQESRFCSGWTPLMMASACAAYLCVEELLAHSDIDAFSEHGFDALMEAAASASASSIELLLPLYLTEFSPDRETRRQIALILAAKGSHQDATWPNGHKAGSLACVNLLLRGACTESAMAALSEASELTRPFLLSWVLAATEKEQLSSDAPAPTTSAKNTLRM